MTAPIGKTVYVLPGFTGPTGTFKQVNILGTFTGPTGTFPIWNQGTGPSGPTGTFESVINIGPTGAKGEVKTVIIPGFSGGGGAGSAFNPADKTADITLSNNNLTASNTDASNGGVRGTTAHSTGKWMIQFTACTLNAADTLDYVGIGTLADTLGLAQGQQKQVILVVSGTSFSGDGAGGVNTFGDALNIPAAATVDLCVDLDGALFWFRVNGGNWNASGTANPATGVGGHAIKSVASFVPYVRLTGAGKTCTINTNPASPPSGFSAWG